MSKQKIITSYSFKDFSLSDKYQKKLARRHSREKLLKISGLSAIIISCSFLLFLIFNILYKANGAFFTTYVKTPIYLDSDLIKNDDRDYLEKFRYRSVLLKSISKNYKEINNNRRDKMRALNFFSKRADLDIRKYVLKNPDKIGEKVYIWVKTSSKIDQYKKKNSKNLGDVHKLLYEKYFTPSDFKKKFNHTLFTKGDSTEPELAGIAAAFIGSIFTMIIFLLVSFPLAVLLSLYLEEFAPKNKFSDFIEININNLAAIPSIIFGLLGLSIFINFFHMPRSSALVGGFTLSLMVLPTIVIATRNSIKAIPTSIKTAALGLGASKVQVALHHTLPLAMPGIFTGTILAVARALGETAPLIMIGMIAFIVDIPSNFFDPTTVLPVQIYLWSNNPEIGFVEKTSAIILILLIFLILFNSIAIYFRNKYSQKW
ncbi:MAG: phosphate ABC transporter permease PstA [Rickettsiales bacterium]|nr:phosphate ABC transporter permease PstA [Rickettsiales bacterium]